MRGNQLPDDFFSVARNARAGQEFTEMANILLGQHGTVVGTMECTLDTVQNYPHPGTVPRLDIGAD